MRLMEFTGITPQVLNQVEAYADRLFSKLGIDVEFTRHFHDRLNDERNRKPITPAELIRLFREVYHKHGKRIAELPDEAEAVMKDMRTDINMPFVIDVNNKGELELIGKTIMRKPNFRTSNQEFTV